MKLPVVNKIHLWSFILSMPFISLALNYVMYGNRVYTDWRIWAESVPLIYLIGLFSWFGHELYHNFTVRTFPGIDQTKRRVLMKCAVNLLVMTPSVLLILFTYHYFHILGYSLKPDDLTYGYLVGLAVNIVFETLWEVVYIIEKYKETAREMELLEEMHLQQEFENLKMKVNPHFLFNCFNTLSSLISEDKEQAETFLDELSKVYRYLLRNNENGMSTVEKEVNFIQSYYQLLKTRHGEGFSMDVQIDPVYMQYELPALSLQLLVENAVKHNVVSRQKPIAVSIVSTGSAYLEIQNNLAKKKQAAESTGIGLQNIRDKYRLLRRHDMEVREEEGRFVVKLPLIAGHSGS
ncbi:sensor histidine kinase [Chitinophaga sp. GCM10012297]|uniref:Histidine kinase n=1 Tax=Chitinophaga chungangae TaxID=2821488 RepID=A0ABS3YJE6_9BACT|nr:histidine kinase [Chitinophaga chungangae]MBO9154812.1 histidine kinase [Chitinophaga chungangae]